jgi:hypothetical protein
MSVELLSKVQRSTIPAIDRTREIEWLRSNEKEYLGQWVALDGNRLIGVGLDPCALLEKAREEGISRPLIHHVQNSDEAQCGGWLSISLQT